MLSPEQRQNLIDMAEAAYENAYAPYSDFPVGAALLTTDGKIYAGCNVENISFGLTNCAERSAIYSAISQDGSLKIKAIAVANKRGIPCSPCGACRQVINEFGAEATIIYQSTNGYIDAPMSKLLPGAFDQL